MLLPDAALARWRSAELSASSDDPSARVLSWIARLRARMLATGGRLTPLLVAAGLCELEHVVACLHAQLDAGWPGENSLGHDIDADLWAVASLAPPDLLEPLSARLSGLADHGRPSCDALHIGLARKLFANGREREAEATLARVGWHSPLIRLLEETGPELSPAMREQLCERAARLVEASHLPVIDCVGVFARLAVISGDARWLARARETLVVLAPEQLEATPDYPHPFEDIAWALAELGEFDEAMAWIDRLDAHDRWAARVRLLPHCREPQTRATIIEALIASAEPLDREWRWLVEAAPEAATRILPRMFAIADEALRFEQLAAAAHHLDREHAEPVCAWLLAYAGTCSLSDVEAVAIWADTLDALHESGCASLLEEQHRHALINQLLADPGLDLWREAAPFVPDDRVAEVLEHAYVQLGLADHYYDRERWIALAVSLLDRAPSELVERWRARSAEALVRTGIEDKRYHQLSIWSDQREAILRGRLRHHQREFLPKQLIDPWLRSLGWELPPDVFARVPAALARIPADLRARQLERIAELTIAVVEDQAERARYEAMLDQLIERPGWPTHEQVIWAFALLGRCRGEAAIEAALLALAAA